MDSFGWVPFDVRPDFMDLTPIFHSEEERAVVNIAYSDKFCLVFAYFRAIMKSNEKSERALEISKEAALLNPANYTVWKYRRDLVDHLGKNIEDEIKFCRDVIYENPKNYQVWHHLRLLVDKSRRYEEEFKFTDYVLEEDAKNYHAWQHRQWVVKEFDLWSNELAYSERLINDDIHNNSAWNYRYYVVKSTTGFSSNIIDQEIQFTLAQINKAPHNESAWNYLLGIVPYINNDQRSIVWEFCKTLANERKHRSFHLLSFMVTCLYEILDDVSTDRVQAKDQALGLLDELEYMDPVRKMYWRLLRTKF